MKSRLPGMLFLLLFSQAIWAANSGDQYWFGRVAVLSSDNPSMTPSYALGASYGVNVTRTASVEVDAYKSMAGGAADEGPGELGWSGLAGSMTYRGLLSRVAYIKGKLGVMGSDLSYTGPLSDESETRFDPVVALGAGVIEHRIIGRRFIVEGEVSYLNDNNYLGTVGLHVMF